MEKLTKPQKAFYENLLLIRENIRSYGSPEKFANCMCILKGNRLYCHYHDMYHKIVNLGIFTVYILNGQNRAILARLTEKGYIEVVNHFYSYEVTIKLLEVKEND